METRRLKNSFNSKVSIPNLIFILSTFRMIALIFSVLRSICLAKTNQPPDVNWSPSFACRPWVAPVWRSSMARFSAHKSFVGTCFHPTQQAPTQQSQSHNNSSRNVPGVRHNAPFHFPAERNLSGVCRGIVSLGADDGLILNTGPLPATFPGLKTSCSQRLWGAVAELYEEQASCRMLKPRLNYTGESGSLSLSSERMNQMIPLLVSHQLFSSCCARQNLASWGMWPQWTAPRGNYRCIQIEFVPSKSCPALLSWDKYAE